MPVRNQKKTPTPSRPRPTTSMPVIAPPLKATSSAGPMPCVAACAVRTLARTETFMPMKPQAPDSTAPITKPTAVVPSRKMRDQDREHHADDGDGLVLPRQVGGGALLDRAGDLLHARDCRRPGAGSSFAARSRRRRRPGRRPARSRAPSVVDIKGSPSLVRELRWRYARCGCRCGRALGSAQRMLREGS